MKKFLIIIISLYFINILSVNAQPVPPTNHGNTQNQPGGGAPIDGGVGFLLVLGAFYSFIKVNKLRTKQN